MSEHNKEPETGPRSAMGVYSKVVVDHALRPRNMGELPGFDGYARKTEGDCGDTLEIWIKADQGILSEVNFYTDGCAATIASGSMTTVLAKGKTVAGAQQISQHDVLAALEGLPEGNKHCALFALSVLKAALRDYLDLQRDPWKKAYRKY